LKALVVAAIIEDAAGESDAVEAAIQKIPASNGPRSQK